MDFKEKYQEALERAKQGLPIDEVFPELKESEDEKIRKEIISCIKSHVLPGGLLIRGGEFYREDAISYLEKQKEPKDISASTMAPGCWQGEEKSAGWSEEDEKIFNSLYTVLQGGLSSIPTEKFISWLKSLRPQLHWKPSEEQINYLAKAIQTLGEEGDCKTANILNELLNDIKHYNYETQKQRT